MSELSRTPHVIAITGGKGGVGKTSIAINLAIALSKSGSKVCLFDGDTSLANTNVMLGLYPAFTLEHLFTGERSIQEIVMNGPEGIQIVPGASGVAQCVELDVGQQQRLVTSIRAIEKHYDYMLIDTAAGIGPTVLHFIAASQLAVLVITPEPTSLTDAFSLLKVLKRRGYRRKAQVIVNMAANPSQAKKAYLRFSQAVAKYLKISIEYLGSVWMDESMRNAVATQRPVALYPKSDPSARCFYRLADKLSEIVERPNKPCLPFSEYWQKVVERQHATKASDKAKSMTAMQPSTALSATPSQSLVAENKSLTQVQKQLQAKIAASSTHQDAIVVEAKPYEPFPEIAPLSIKNDLDAPITIQPDDITIDAHQANGILEVESENAWLAMRLQMNRLMNDSNTTPEQVITLLSSAIYSYGDRLGNASVDLLHGLLHSLDPETLSNEHKQLLLNDYERIGLDTFKQQQDQRMEQARSKAVEIDDQPVLVQTSLERVIRSSAPDIPLESLLESIKYASLVDSSND